MSDGYNKCIFVGRLGKDAELRHMPNGDPVLSFSVGANESWKNAKGEKQERCEWVNCSLFGKRADALAKYLEKGTRVLVEGKLRTDKSEKNGETKYFTKLIVDEVVLLGDRKREDSSESTSTGRGGAGGPRQREPEPPAEDDEIPFVRNETISGRWERP